MSKYIVFSHKGGVRTLVDNPHAHTHARVILYGHLCFFLSRLPTIFSQSAHSVRVGEKFLSSLRVVEHVSTTKTTHSISILRLWRNICSCRCILCPLLPNDIRVLFHEKALFLRFTFSFTSLIPCLLPPTDEREKTERTTAQLPANKKCCLLIFAIAIGCLVLAAIPASSLPVTLVHPVLPFPFLSAVMLSAISRRANLPLLVMHFALPPARTPPIH